MFGENEKYILRTDLGREPDAGSLRVAIGVADENAKDLPARWLRVEEGVLVVSSSKELSEAEEFDLVPC